MSKGNEKKPVKNAPRWMKITLVLSLAFNLLVFGAIGARVAFGPPLGPPRGLGAPGVMLMEGRRMVRKLPVERRRILRGIVDMHRIEMGNHRSKIAASRAKLAHELAEDKLDMAAFKAAMVKMQMAESEGYETVMRMREDFLRALTSKERRMFASGLLKHQESRRRGPPWRGDN